MVERNTRRKMEVMVDGRNGERKEKRRDGSDGGWSKQ